ncbi:ABC-type protease/lipase transport system, ATPase and permease components [Serratia quinivorans]|uniref:DUF4214 domain-containing protein n=1 Tax=Serratia quinivorans TaxID=137545 RepID=UPI002177BFE0|nr:DUF4214 domain-containing protein [Serratia quinivorans]CAI0932430.1 ABC-type protease/lipase transport system, ATPase and permease components [Serratia quinivorans]CAI0949825.1 ABC-type protease/lipase transport system, ATPase and permease components [Serratia quinivorans]CAI1738776.1 ABC-type protease/lipase transport system, ATPase and permease components [Serratia quinivorans]CAI2095882.1 ABC-type protease/lipase transport system, ATPase and permease components [Serratia quinivorans]CAI
MIPLSTQQEVGALIIGIFGRLPTVSEIDYYDSQFDIGSQPPAYMASILMSQPDADWMNGQSEYDILTSVYLSVYNAYPDPDYINELLMQGHFNSAIASVVIDLFNYLGDDPAILAQRDALDQRIAEGLFPSVADDAVGGAGDAIAMFYLLKAPWLADEINSYGRQLNQGGDLGVLAQEKIETLPINNLSDGDFILQLFEQGFERPPTAAELSDYQNQLAGGATRGDLLVAMIEQLRGEVAPEDQAAQQHFNDAGYQYPSGELPATVYLEQVAALFRAIPERSIDAASLDTWSKTLASGTLSYPELVAALLATPEFQGQIGDLQGDAFIQHVYQAVHGRAADEQQLAHYRALGDDKGAITQAVVEDLITNDVTGGVTQSEQWAFAREIGQSLAYKTTASLGTSEEGGNAYGTVNTHVGHSLSNAETAVLFRVFLNADKDVSVDLSYASQLSYLTINGEGAAAIQLHHNPNVKYGVAVTVNNANVTLDGTYGSDQVQLTALADVAAASGNFNLSEGNDSLLWAGNATGGANHVGWALRADGGAGMDILSANLIVKLTSTLDLWGMRVSTVSSNAANFSHFEQLDMAGYIGQAEATLNKVSWSGIKTEKLVTEAHVFDYGVLNGHATVEGTLGGYVVQDRAANDLGSGGLLLSDRADNVKVINANADAARLEISSVGDQADSRLEIDFLANATHRVDLLFSGSGNVGSLALGSHGSENPLELIAINAAGWGRSALTLTGSNDQVHDIVLSGRANFNLTLEEGYHNVGLIDASAFASNAFTLNSAHGGSGNGTLIQMLDLLPLSGASQAKLDPLLAELGLVGEQLLVKGGGGNDQFNITGDTTLIAGAGHNSVTLQSSTAASGVTLKGFSLQQDSITDVLSGVRLSHDAGGRSLADYGTSNGQNIEARIGVLGDEQMGSASQLLAALLDLGKPGALSAKVGVSSVLADQNSSYIIVDNNNDHRLDAADTVILLLGQDHQMLLSELRYLPPEVTITATASTEESLVA